MVTRWWDAGRGLHCHQGADRCQTRARRAWRRPPAGWRQHFPS